MVLYTGDSFRMDQEGYLYFVGRKDDMIKSRGERISPREIELCLCSMENVVEAAVIGIPHETLGEAIVACIRRRDGSRLSENDVLKHCQIHLEDFMVPKLVKFLTSFPNTHNSKTDKRTLKADYIEALRKAPGPSPEEYTEN
jgi:acyl-coenzyme A synthetase/AMP-(fatty) acid ligase